MFLDRLKYWREYYGYSLRQLAEKSKIPYSAISLLENCKREPQGRTVHKLAAALGVALTDLYDQEQPPQPQPAPVEVKHPQNDNKPIKKAAVKRAATRLTIKEPVKSFWVFERDQEGSDPFRLDTHAEAARLKERLGHYRARVYQAASRSEASAQHTQFLIKVARGHAYW